MIFSALNCEALRDVRSLGEAVNLNSFSDEIHGLPKG